MENSHANAYPHLANLLGAWFHQDFDIEGETIEAVMMAYRRVAGPEEKAAVRADIRRFLRDAGSNADAEFTRVFQPDIDPAGWDMTAAEWLARVDELLVD